MNSKPNNLPTPVLQSFNRFKISYFISCIILTISNLAFLSAQPSGGPYGPLPQYYDVPKGPGRIYYVSPEGKRESTGENIATPTSMEAAIDRVSTGDFIILRGGTYRTGNLLLNQGVTIQPYADEQPVIKGTQIATQWEKLSDNLWVTTWKTFFPSKPDNWWQRERNGFLTPMHRFNNDMVFIDGRFLQSAGWEGEVDKNSFYINYETGQVFIGSDPSNRLIEITAYNIAIHRVMGEVHGKTSDMKGPVIRGITFTQYAYRAIEIEGIEPQGISSESAHGKEVTGATIENCVISFCSRVAAYLRGDRLTIRHCKITDTSTEGIYIIASSDVLLEKNIFTRNNIENITGYFPAAVKIFNQSYRVTFNDNLVIDLPNSNGVWYDVGNVDGIFTNNWVENVGYNNGIKRNDQLWPSDNGFFFEISKGAVCAGNVFVNCDHGLMILNSCNVQIYQNTFINSTACIGRDGRSAVGDHFGWHPSAGPDVDKRDGHVFVNNLLTADNNYQRPLLFIWQRNTLCEQLRKTQVKQMDNNVYISNSHSYVPIILWGPVANDTCQLAFKSLKAFQEVYPEFSAKSMSFDNTKPVFKSTELGNFQLTVPFKGSTEACHLPDEVMNLLKLPKNYKPYFGAYSY
jgi:hypothetical protein